MENIYKFAMAVLGGLVGFVFGGWTTLLGILLSVVVADLLTGIIASGIEGKLNSSKGMKGIAKKVVVFFVVAVAHMLDIALGYNGNILRDATIFFFLANESLSILENVARIGVPIPGVLKRAIDILNEKSEGEDK